MAEDRNGDRERFNWGAQPFLDDAPRVSYERGETLGSAGEPCHRLLVLVKGIVLLRRPAASGDREVRYLLTAGDPVGEECLQDDRAWQYTAEAQTRVTAHSFPLATLPRQVSRFPGLAAYLLGRLGRRREAAADRVRRLAGDVGRERLLSVMQVTAERLGDIGERTPFQPVPYAEDELAHLTGITEGCVESALSELEAEGQVRRGAGGLLWVNLLGSWLLAAAIAARMFAGPGLFIVVDEETQIIRPFRIRRGRVQRVTNRPPKGTFTMGPGRVQFVARCSQRPPRALLTG